MSPPAPSSLNPDAPRAPLRDLYCTQLPVCNDVSGFTVVIATRQKVVGVCTVSFGIVLGTWSSTQPHLLTLSCIFKRTHA